MAELDDLHRLYAGFLEESRRWSQPLPPSDDHVFFVPGFTIGGDDTVWEPTPLPYPSLWMVIEWAETVKANGRVVIAHVTSFTDQDGEESIAMAGYGVAPSGRWGRVNFKNTDASQVGNFEAAIEVALWRMSRHEVVEQSSPHRDRINAGRAKSRKGLPVVPPFLSMGARLATGNGTGTGTHASPIPHDRRGHWRTYKRTGVRIWVNDARVRGGSEAPRFYAAGEGV